MIIRLPIPLPRNTNKISVRKFRSGVLSLTKSRFPVTAINTYRNAKKTALILILRLRFLVVMIIRNGAEMITKKANSWSGEKVSLRKSQPKTK